MDGRKQMASCIFGRRQRSTTGPSLKREEEVEGVDDIFGNKAILAGFSSYGEIALFTFGAEGELHNQTMTIASFLEIQNHGG